MRRFLLAVLLVLLVGVVPGLAQQSHVLVTEMKVGSFVAVPATHRHFAFAGPEETLIQVHGVGPTDITFVNAADDPRKK